MEKIKNLLNLEEDPAGGACPLDKGLVEKIDALVREIMASGRGEELFGLINPLMQGKDGGDALYFTAARAQALAGLGELASSLYTILCERMEQQDKWDALIPTLELAIDECGTADLARLVARVWERKGTDLAPVSLLRKALALAGSNHRILWALGNSLFEEGDDAGRILIARSLPGFARKKDYDRVEEGVLSIAEGAGRKELKELITTIGYLLKAKEIDRILTLLEFVKDPIIKEGLSGEGWKMFRKYLEKSADNVPLRKVAAEFGPGAYPDVFKPENMFSRAGIADPEVDIHEAFATLDRLLEVPAGRYVYHHGWGVGQITDNDGEFLEIHFEGKPAHRMALKLATSALLFLAPTDLRAKMFVDKEEVLRGARENRPDLLFSVLEHVGGEAKQEEIKKQLVHLGILTTSTWADWWKQAKKGAEGDPRFDFSQSFRKLYRLNSEGSSPLAVPEMSLAANFRKGITLLFGFLDQHPDGAPDVERRYGKLIQKLANNVETLPADRMLGHVLLHQVGCPDEEGISWALDAMMLTCDMGTISSEKQKLLLKIVPEKCVATAARLLLTSRIITVRREGWSALVQLPAEDRQRVVSGILEKSPHGGNAVLHLARELMAVGGGMVADLIHALLYLLEDPEKENHRKEAIEIVGSTEFRAFIDKHESTEGEMDYLRSRLVHWKHSERFLFPVLETLRGTHLRQVAEEVESARISARPRVETSALEEYGGRSLMTRSTIDRLRKEVEELDWDLKTSIPRMIRKARELGDLKENAEYDAARNKQRESTKRLEELYERIRLAKPIEELNFDPGKVGPGAEVLLRSDQGEERKYWVLGEGDRELGEDVVSYRAPLGICLMGKNVGDEITLPDNSKFQVVSLTHKLPDNSD